MTLENAYNTGRYPSYTTSNGVVPAGQLRHQPDLHPERRRALPVHRNKIDDFVGYNQQQAIATGAATSADAIPGGKTDYNNALFNAGLLAHLTDRQQTGSISLRASRSRTRASITATAPTR